MKIRVVLLVLLGFALLATAWASSAEKSADTPKALCPVKDKPIDTAFAADYRDGKVNFCCKGCIAKFNGDKEKYATKANLQLVQTGQAKQVGCPLSGKPAKADQTLVLAGVSVQFCCGNCPKKVSAAEADKQLERDKAFCVAQPTRKASLD